MIYNKISFISIIQQESEENLQNTKTANPPEANQKETEQSTFNAYNFINDIQTIYSNKKFVMVNLSYFILSFVIVVPYNFLPSYIKLNSIQDPSSISISLLGISALFGQIIIGYLSDKYRSKNWVIFSLCIICAGLLTCLLPMTKSLYSIYLYCVLFGLLTSVNYVLQSSLVIESLGLANLTIAFGCLQLSQGRHLRNFLKYLLFKKKDTLSFLLKDFQLYLVLQF